MMKSKFSRRQVLATSAATAAALAMPFVQGAHAAGTISVGFWDHWVPGANDTLTKLCNEWAEKSKVEVKIDYITSQGSKNLLTAAAEMQARYGHDILAHPTGRSEKRRVGKGVTVCLDHSGRRDIKKKII